MVFDSRRMKADGINNKGAVTGMPYTDDALAQIREWVQAELKPWRFFSHDSQDIRETLHQAINGDPSVFQFNISNGLVNFKEKPQSDFSSSLEHHDLTKRCSMYVGFLQAVVDSFKITYNVLLAIDLDDLLDYKFNCPVLCFQKHIGSSRLLIPDVDFIDRDFYISDKSEDYVDYNTKIDAAVFVGSTTGILNISSVIVERLEHQRIRSAVYFKGSSDVKFELPNIVQCDSRDTEIIIRDLNIGSTFSSWKDQLNYRYLISVDGNGATCSRVALSLKSNSVLIKYDSYNELYYFKGLKPWQHYIPVGNDAEVLHNLDLVRDSPTLPKTMAIDSSHFYRTRLSRIAIMTYMAEFLNAYAATFDDHNLAVTNKNSFVIDSFAHISNQGNVWSKPNGWLEADTGGWIESICLINGPEIQSSDLLYLTIDQDGLRSAYTESWQINGSRGQSRPIIGFEVLLKGEAANRFDLSYEARFLDGTFIASVAAGKPCVSQNRAPLTGFRLIARRRKGYDGATPQPTRSVESTRPKRWWIGNR